MKIAIIGSGGREHAIYHKVVQSVSEDDVFALPGNGGIKNSVNIGVSDFAQIKSFCDDKHIETIIVGPEVPLAEGITDYFKDTSINVFGPSKAAAVLESSKIYAKKFMKTYGVSTANYWTFNNIAESRETVDKLNGNLVIKYDGLAAGKGVYVCSSKEETKTALEEMSNKYGDDVKYLIEEKLTGKEMSIIGITDGKSIKLLTPSQDHKQLNEGDKGPNTGGMGAYCPASFISDELSEKITSKIVNPTLKGIQSEGFNYKGFIYFGLMIVSGEPYLLEYNIRSGDPETEVILPALDSDLLDLVQSCFDGTLGQKQVKFKPGYYVDVVLVSGGYPYSYGKGYEISGLDALDKDTIVFHAGTSVKDGKLVTSGGRVLNIVVNGDSLSDAIDKAYRECNKISFRDMYCRKDIGKRDL